MKQSKLDKIRKRLAANARRIEKEAKQAVQATKEITSSTKFKELVEKIRENFQLPTHKTGKALEKHVKEYTKVLSQKLNISESRVKSMLFNKTYKDDNYQHFVDQLEYDMIDLNAPSSKVLKPEVLLSKIQDGHKLMHFNGKNYLYKDFLSSRYWKSLADFLVKNRKKCQHCGKTHDLCVHHQTYWCVGREYDNLNMLTVLCKGCHHKEHLKLDKQCPGWLPNHYIECEKQTLEQLLKKTNTKLYNPHDIFWL